MSELNKTGVLIDMRVLGNRPVRIDPRELQQIALGVIVKKLQGEVYIIPRNIRDEHGNEIIEINDVKVEDK